MNETSDALTGLVKKIDQQMAASSGKSGNPLGVYVIHLNQRDGLDTRLREWSAKDGIKQVFLSIGVPPKDYDVANDADITVVIYNPERRNRQTVIANFALRKGELDACRTEAIVKAIADVLPK